MSSVIRGSDDFDSATYGVNVQASVATTSGTSIDFTGIPSGVKRIQIMYNRTSLSSTADNLIQLMVGGIVITVGYSSNTNFSGYPSTHTTNGIVVYGGNAVNAISAIVTIASLGGNAWTSAHSGKYSTTNSFYGGGSVDLAGEVDGIRLTSVGGTNTFDAGSAAISWES